MLRDNEFHIHQNCVRFICWEEGIAIKGFFGFANQAFVLSVCSIPKIGDMIIIFTKFWIFKVAEIYTNDSSVEFIINKHREGAAKENE